MSVPTGRRWWAAVALIWLAAAALYVWVARDMIATWAFADADDPMRLQQVRDLLAGQSWFDLVQHRMNPPLGTPMHWSRWVDLPIALAILAARPFAGAPQAELIACVAVPLLTLGACAALSAMLARRLIGPGAGLAAAALAPLTAGALQQMKPLRIDHHGWQMVLALAVLLGALDRNPRRGGFVAGGCAALWLAISLEGLPLAAAAGGLLGMRWLLAPEREGARFAAYAAALAGGEALLFALTHRGAGATAIACDAVTLVHVAALACAAVGSLLAVRFASRAGFTVRLAALATTALAAGIAYRGIAPQCAGGAFAQLDPLVYRYWYLNVPEGMPLWRQGRGAVALAIGFPIVGLAGALLAWRGDPRARDWFTHLVLLAAAMIVTLFVERGGGAANLLALPGGLWLMTRAFAAADGMRHTVPRVLASAAAGLALLPITPALSVAALPKGEVAKPAEAAAEVPACTSVANLATAGALPPSILFTAMDIGPGLLVTTRHAVVASSHHRNAAGMHDVIAAFLAAPAAAERIVRRHRARYVVTCPRLEEMDIYRAAAPHGLWAALAAGRPPAWLRPVRLPGSPLAVWEVVG